MIREIHTMKNVTVSFERGGKLIVGVEKKVPLSKLNPRDRIPKTLPDGRKTDVIIIPKIRSLSYCDQEISGCGIHAIKCRPVVGGVSYAPSTSGAATLGALVVDSLDNTIVALTNNHVIGPVLGTGSSTPDYWVSNVAGVNMLQPSPLDGGTISDQIGIGKRAVPTIFGGSGVGTNLVDAAIGTISGINITLPGVQSLVRGGSFPFAEKNTYYAGSECRKIGRTTGHSVGTIYHTNVNVTAIFGADEQQNHAYYEGVIMITSTERFSAGGDSGSMIFVKSGGVWQIIGILFAGSDDGLTTFACHIADVATLLDVESWDGHIYLPIVQTEVIQISGICYYDTGEDIANLQTHAHQRTFSSCEDCIFNASTKTLFGNML
jgi:hypothetical protein